MSTPVCGGPPPTAAEELVLGPPPVRRLPRRLGAVALGLGLLIVAAAATWVLWPRPIAPVSLADLQDTYAGMVRSDGTNDASVLTRRTVPETPVIVSPSECAALVQATIANRFPDAALDGVGTYWLSRESSISLFTLRFADAATAAAERTRIATALDACAGRQVLTRGSDTGSVGVLAATVARTSAGSGGDGQLGYVLSEPDGLMAIQLMPYLNTLTWQFRYETGSSTYSPLAADQLMRAMRSQLGSVIAARAR